MLNQQWEVSGRRQFAVDGRQRVDFVDEILLVDEPRLGRQLDQDIRPGPAVASDVELMTGILPRRTPAARGRHAVDAAQLIERRRFQIDVWRDAVGH